MVGKAFSELLVHHVSDEIGIGGIFAETKICHFANIPCHPFLEDAVVFAKLPNNSLSRAIHAFPAAIET